MTARNSALRYGSVAMTLHWLIAVFILINIALGIWFNEVMGRYDAGRFGVIQLHKSIGLTVLVLSVVRLAWRLVNPVPPLPVSMSRTTKVLAHATHYALYALMIAVPVLGWMLVSASRTGIPTMYFGEIPWPNLAFIADLPRDQKIALGHSYSTGHIVAAFLLLALVLGHAAAAFYHHFKRRDRVLIRMLPGGSAARLIEG